jgi:norsolorinic acid ketoreductase
VIAGVRDPSASSKALKALPVAAGTKLIIVKIDSTSDTDAKAAVETLKTEHGIKKLDVVIANAGLGDSWEKVLNTSVESVRQYTEVNTIGPLVLFQAVYPLLEAASQPKFVIMATAISSFGLMEHFPIPSAGYGASKAAISYIGRKIHFEHQNVISVSIYPGYVTSLQLRRFFFSDYCLAGSRQKWAMDLPSRLECRKLQSRSARVSKEF